MFVPKSSQPQLHYAQLEQIRTLERFQLRLYNTLEEVMFIQEIMRPNVTLLFTMEPMSDTILEESPGQGCQIEQCRLQKRETGGYK